VGLIVRAGPPEAAPRSSGLWHNPDFLKLWAGQTISQMGSRITRDGLPLLAVITLGASPVQMGLLTALESLPVILAGLLVGVWVDRLQHRPVLIAADLGRGLLLLLIPLAAVTGWLRLEMLYLLVVLLGALTIFFDVAYVAYLPALVRREHVVEGNSKLSLTDSAAEIIGPGLAGVLVQTITAPLAILADALSFFGSVASLLAIRKPEPPLAPLENRRHWLEEAREGLALVWHDRRLRALAVAGAVLRLFGSMIGPLYGLYAIRVLGLGPAALGATIAVGGVGSLLGSLLAGPALRRLGTGRTLVSTLALGSFFTLLLPLAGGSPLRAMLFLIAAQLFGDALQTIYGINEVSLRQTLTPDRFLGRANAAVELLAAAAVPVGALLGGLIGELAGVRLALFVASSKGFLAALVLFVSPVYALVEFPVAGGNEPG
jgi:MFS family permease